MVESKHRADRPVPTAQQPQPWVDTRALVTRLRRTTFRTRSLRLRSVLRPASALASFALVVAAVTPGLASWVEETGADVRITSATIQLDVAGDLAFELTGCSSGGRSCSRFEDEALAGLPTSRVGSSSLAVTKWIDKEGEVGEHVGLEFSVAGAEAEVEIKSGNPAHDGGSLYALDPVLPGNHLWVNPACTLDGVGDTVSCNPAATSAISYLEVCFPSEGRCDGIVEKTLNIANEGTLPVSVGLTLSDPVDAVCAGPPFDVVLSTTDRLLYSGSLCFLVDEPVALFDDLAPGEHQQVQMSVALGVGAEPDPGEVALDLVATVAAIQWNNDSGWRTRTSLPMSVTADIAAPCEPAPDIVEPPTIEPPAVDPPDLKPPADRPVVGPPDDPPVVDPPVDPPVVDPPVNPPDDPPVVNPPVEPPSVKPPNDPPDDSPVVAPPEEPPVLAPPDDPPVVEPPEKPPVVEPPVVEPVEVPVDSSTAAATGVVWVDDGDGIRPAANPSAGSAGEREPRLAGVTVRLLGPEGDSLVETRTDTRGRYEFVALPAGQYRVEFEAPPGYQFTVASAGGDATRDSDVVSTEVREKPGVAPLILGTTILSDLAVDQSLTWDAGLLPIPTDDSTPEPPPAEDPDELATEPPEPTAGREEPPPVDPPTGDGDESNGRVESGAGRGG